MLIFLPIDFLAICDWTFTSYLDFLSGRVGSKGKPYLLFAALAACARDVRMKKDGHFQSYLMALLVCCLHLVRWLGESRVIKSQLTNTPS